MSTPFFSAPETGITLTPSTRQPWSQGDAIRAFLVAVCVGVAIELSRTAGFNGVAGSLVVLVGVAAFLVVARPTRRTLVWPLLALAVAPWFTFRASPWLIGPDVLAIALFTALAATGVDGLATTFSQLAQRVCSLVPASFRVPGDVLAAGRSAFPTTSVERRNARLRGLALAVPMAFVLLGLLVSGDRFFASVVGIGEAGELVGRVLGGCFGAFAFFVLVARHRIGPRHRTSQPALVGLSEAFILLSVLTGVLAVYVSSTVAAALAGREYVARRTGLTYAEYARSGFFQLIAVVLVVVGVLMTLRPSTDHGATRGRTTVLSLSAIALTLGVVGVSLSRLQTYRSVYGLTMLRFSTTVFAAWLGLVLVLVGLSFCLVRFRSLLVSTIVVSGAVVLVLVNIVNPEALVVRENIGRLGQNSAVAPDTFDGYYLTNDLGDDAIPTLVANLDRLSEHQQSPLLSRLCTQQPLGGTWSWNRSRMRARRAAQEVCSGWDPTAS